MNSDARQDTGPRRRSFVFLQGPTSTVFRDLGRSLAARGHHVLRINFCPGDWIFWHGADTVRYAGSLEDWPDYLEDVLRARKATDLVYFADRFPYHKAAKDVAKRLGVRPVSMEYGYLRPDWIVLEEGGHSAYSHFPADPLTLHKAAQDLPAVMHKRLYDIPAWHEMICEPLFHLSNAILRSLTPHYRPDRYYSEFREFPAYLPRFLRRSRNARAARSLIEDLSLQRAPMFLVPLQMQNDYQIRDNAPPGYQHRFVREVLASFQRAAPTQAVLVFKLHPMDNGLERWDRLVPRLAAELGLESRVHVLDGATLTKMFPFTTGCIVINSTSGLEAIRAGVPTKVMGIAVYDITGLTNEGPLDAFWTTQAPPDAALVRALVRCLAYGVHVRGTVYGAAGRAAFVQNAAARLEADALHGHALYMAEPPRLADARARGILAASHDAPEDACARLPA